MGLLFPARFPSADFLSYAIFSALVNENVKTGIYIVAQVAGRGPATRGHGTGADYEVSHAAGGVSIFPVDFSVHSL
jgi:hypothetical protein